MHDRPYVAPDLEDFLQYARLQNYRVCHLREFERRVGGVEVGSAQEVLTY